eukprot:4661622-Prymnesium_polylepis.1
MKRTVRRGPTAPMSGSSVNCAASASLAIVPISECAILRRRVTAARTDSLSFSRCAASASSNRAR